MAMCLFLYLIILLFHPGSCAGGDAQGFAVVMLMLLFLYFSCFVGFQKDVMRGTGDAKGQPLIPNTSGHHPQHHPQHHQRFSAGNKLNASPVTLSMREDDTFCVFRPDTNDANGAWAQSLPTGKQHFWQHFVAARKAPVSC